MIVIEACRLVQKVLNVPEDLVLLVNSIIGSAKYQGHELPREVTPDNIEVFNDIFFHSLLSAYPETKSLNTSEEAGFCFVIIDDVFGLQYNNSFFHLK